MKQMSKLTLAFKALRKAGYFARQNFWCCQSCGWLAVPDGTEKVVFFHKQDADGLRRTGRVHLAWSGDGVEICRILGEHGVRTEWNGSGDKRILAGTNSNTLTRC